MKVHENKKPVTGNQEHEVKKVPLTTAGSQGPNLRHVKVIQGPVARAKASCSRASSMNVRSSSITVRCSSNLHCLFCSIRFTKRTCFLTYLKLHFKNEPDQYLGGGEPSHSSIVVGSQENTHRKQDISTVALPAKSALGKRKACSITGAIKNQADPISAGNSLVIHLAFLMIPLRQLR